MRDQNDLNASVLFALFRTVVRYTGRKFTISCTGETGFFHAAIDQQLDDCQCACRGKFPVRWKARGGNRYIVRVTFHLKASIADGGEHFTYFADRCDPFTAEACATRAEENVLGQVDHKTAALVGDFQLAR